MRAEQKNANRNTSPNDFTDGLELIARLIQAGLRLDIAPLYASRSATWLASLDTFDDDAMALLAREGYDPAFGARPLKRVIQREIGDRAAVIDRERTVIPNVFHVELSEHDYRRLAVFKRYFLDKWRKTLDAKAEAWPERFDFAELKRIDSFVGITRRFVHEHTQYGSLQDYLGGYTLTPPMLAASITAPAAVTSDVRAPKTDRKSVV